MLALAAWLSAGKKREDVPHDKSSTTLELEDLEEQELLRSGFGKKKPLGVHAQTHAQQVCRTAVGLQASIHSSSYLCVY